MIDKETFEHLKKLFFYLREVESFIDKTHPVIK
jgi:hypothetical protein